MLTTDQGSIFFFAAYEHNILGPCLPTKKPYVAHFLGKLVPKDKLVTVSVGKLAPVGK